MKIVGHWKKPSRLSFKEHSQNLVLRKPKETTLILAYMGVSDHLKN